MVDMQDYSTKISIEEEVGLIERLQEAFSLEEPPRIALVRDLTNKLGNFRDVVAYSGIPYFIRIEKSTGKTVYYLQQESHIHINYPLCIEDQRDLCGFLYENQEFADEKIKLIKQI